MVLVPFGGELLAFTRDQFEEARRRGQELSPAEVGQPTAQKTEILDAAEMEKRTSIPASWWLEQARKKAAPHIRAGKYVRFDLNKILDALTIGSRHEDSQSESTS